MCTHSTLPTHLPVEYPCQVCGSEAGGYEWFDAGIQIVRCGAENAIVVSILI